ncbi:MAG: hypothetical protein QM762_27875 [Chryseolinea sp.]
MSRSPVLYIILVIAGLIVLAWPEQDNVMLVQVARRHGPSRLDLIGLLLMAIGYVPLAVITFRRFPEVKKRLTPRVANILVVAYFVSLSIIAIALFANQEALLWFAVAVAAISQFVLTGIALSSSQPRA